jgi:tripeptidyl-peptidase-1
VGEKAKKSVHFHSRFFLPFHHTACESYTVPEHITKHIDIILPTVNFDANLRRPPPPPPAHLVPREIGSLKHKMHSFAQTNGKKIDVKTLVAMTKNDDSPPDLSMCDQVITPDCLRALYNFSYTPVATDRNSYGIGE